MEVDKQENFTGSSPGTFERLDLELPLYIGGLPEGPSPYNTTGFRTGFEGDLAIFAKSDF